MNGAGRALLRLDGSHCIGQGLFFLGWDAVGASTFQDSNPVAPPDPSQVSECSLSHDVDLT